MTTQNTTHSLSPAQINAITAYARIHGRNWRKHLHDDWMHGRARYVTGAHQSALLSLRNTPGIRVADLPDVAPESDWEVLPVDSIYPYAKGATLSPEESKRAATKAARAALAEGRITKDTLFFAANRYYRRTLNTDWIFTK